MFEHGLLNLTNWLGNVILPTLAGLFLAGAVFLFSKGRPFQHYSYAGFAALMCSGLLRVLESFSGQAAWDDPNRFWIAIMALVNWVGNVALPLYGVTQVFLLVLHYAGFLERMTVGEVWARNFISAVLCFGLSGFLRLIEFWIANGTAGVR